MNVEKIFEIISDFINELSCIHTENKSIIMYKLLIDKTSKTNINGINKNIKIFKTFCEDNRLGIESNKEKMINVELKYSENVKINMRDILENSDNDDKKIIRKYLMVLSSLLDKESICKDLLKSDNNQLGEKETDKTKDLISSMVENISSKLDIDENDENLDIGQIMQKMISSGSVSEMFNTVQNSLDSGDIDVNSLLSSAKSMINENKPEDCEDLDIGGIINSVMSNITSSGIVNQETDGNLNMDMMQNLLNSFMNN
jgi:hypothetical protein